MTDAVLSDPQASYALLVGACQYETLDDLPAVQRNLSTLRDLLCTPELWGLPPDHCVVMPEPDSADEVVKALEHVAGRTVETLVVYYAGHGLVDPVTEELNLALTGSDGNRVAPSSLPFDWVRRQILAPEVRARHKVVILDCCWSGRAMQGWMSGDGVANEVANRARIHGACLLTSAAETKKALAPPGDEFTAFTGELITVLRDGIPEGPELLDLDTLYGHVLGQLSAKGRPLPQIRSRNLGGQVSLGRNRALVPPPRRPGALPSAREGTAAPSAGGEPSEEGAAGGGTDGRPVRIGLWGAPASGKTTLLAALSHVIGDTQQDYGSWRVSGLNRVSEEFIVQHKTALVNDGQFPPATEVVGEPLRFRFSGAPNPDDDDFDDEFDEGEDQDDDEEPVIHRSHGFVVEVQDVPGHYFHDTPSTPDSSITQRLAESDGLVYLFDPTDGVSNSSADYLFGLIQRITTYLEETGGPPGRYLPHALAVCVTKFDDPQLFLAARAARWGTQVNDRHGFPRVKDRHARQFVHWAARHFCGPDGDRLCDLIENHFDPDRTAYFATSSIGFHVNDDGVFSPSDFANLNGTRIRGGIRPMNVLEPFIALDRRIRTAAETAALLRRVRRTDRAAGAGP
ncbi:caspase family protein [Streptomyces sp. NPDC048057]|uniref:caspase family protein n=1 Tax=Streptomyces sp. NPDC048057 TaxID=3155628 RepID=UPI0033FBCADA